MAPQMRYIFVDLCGTLTNQENNPAFARYLVKRGAIHHLKYLQFKIRQRLRLDKSDITKLILNQQIRDLQGWANDYVSDHRPDLNHHVRELIESHAEKGHTPVIVSGALGFIVDAYARSLKIERSHGTEIEIDNDGYVTKILPLNIGTKKAELINQNYQDAILEDCAAVGNSDGDMEMLALVGKPFFVNKITKMPESINVSIRIHHKI